MHWTRWYELAASVIVVAVLWGDAGRTLAVVACMIVYAEAQVARRCKREE
jgi:hypothetical protein